MFWDKGYTPSQNIEALLEKENATVEEFLDDEDILLECRSQKKSITNYFVRPDVIKRLVELIITEPSEELPMAQRFRYANMACEILTFGLPSLDEKLLADADTLTTLYSYLENEPPLNPLLSSFFSKTFSMLFTKKAEQDWFLYQQMCLQLLEYIKSKTNFLDLICKHFSTPVIPDLIMQMMKDVEGGQLKRNLYEWLTEDNLVERLIGILGNPQESDKHANVAEFICELIHQGRSMRQTEQENDSFEPAFVGSNPILKVIESAGNIEALLNVILEPNAQESAIVSGISVVLTLIKPVVFVDEPNSDRLKFLQNREKEIHEEILLTVIRVIAPRLKDFNELLRNPPNKPEIVTTAAKLSPPFGMTRLQICRVFTVLLQTRNEEVSKAICETNFFETILGLFKQYCWNNFLHSEVEKCLQLIFYTQLSNNNNSIQGSTIVNDGSFNKNNNDGDYVLTFVDALSETGGGGVDSISSSDKSNGDGGGEGSNMNITTDGINVTGEKDNKAVEEDIQNAAEKCTDKEPTEEKTETENNDGQSVEKEKNNDDNTLENSDSNNSTDKIYITAGNDKIKELGEKVREEDEQEPKPKDVDAIQEKVANENDTTKVHADSAPSALQTYIIVNCKLISKIIDCWQNNRDVESAEKGRRLGYMGHLIKIIKHITNCISESEHIGALIENSLSDASELELWQSIINPNDGDFTKALATQSKMLANCNAHDAGDYVQHLLTDILNDDTTWDFIAPSNMINNLGAFSDSSANDIVFALEHEMYRNDLLDNDDNAEIDLNLFQFGRNIDDDEDDDENTGGGDGHSLFGKTSTSTSALHTFGVTSNPWDSLDPFTDLTANNSNTTVTTPWAADFGADNFADFDSHFSSFTNDLGESLKESSMQNHIGAGVGGGEHHSQRTFKDEDTKLKEEEFDNNANVEKSSVALPNDFDYNVDDNAKNDVVAKSLMRPLHSVMQDSEDDYEDDEGMYMKPLGGSAAQEEDEEEEMKTGQRIAVIANGPTNKEAAIEQGNNENLHNSNDNITVTKNITTATMHSINDPTESNQESNVDASKTNNKFASISNITDVGGTDKKLTSANPVEVASTTT